MKAIELGIGNYYQDRDTGEYGRITAHDIMDLHNGLDSECYQPVLLTPEILEKAGFEKTNLFNSYFLPYTGFRYYFDDQTFNIDGYEVADFKYLHQLQNLYFALTGEELHIEL